MILIQTMYPNPIVLHAGKQEARTEPQPTCVDTKILLKATINVT